MKIVYHAESAVDAQLVADLLNGNDIFAQVRGGQMQGAVGEAPAMGNVKVWVHDEDYERGRELIEQWQNASISDDGFEKDDENTDYRHKPKSVSYFKNAVIFAGGAILALAAQKYWPGNLNMSPTLTDTGAVFKIDVDYDGNDDQIFYYDNYGVITEFHMDQNFDGEVDAITRYDSRGLAESAKVDFDFDGRYETNEEYENGMLKKSESDFDNDGYYEMTYLYHNGQASEGYLNKSSFGSPKKYQKFEKGRLIYAKLDEDGDGKYDVEYYYDDVEEVKSKNNL